MCQLRRGGGEKEGGRERGGGREGGGEGGREGGSEIKRERERGRPCCPLHSPRILHHCRNFTIAITTHTILHQDHDRHHCRHFTINITTHIILQSFSNTMSSHITSCHLRALSSLLGSVAPSCRALSGRLKFTVRRHKFNEGCVCLLPFALTTHLTRRCPLQWWPRFTTILMHAPHPALNPPHPTAGVDKPHTGARDRTPALNLPQHSPRERPTQGGPLVTL